MDVPALLKQLESPIDTVRGSAFYQLLWQPQRGPYDAAARTRSGVYKSYREDLHKSVNVLPK